LETLSVRAVGGAGSSVGTDVHFGYVETVLGSRRARYHGSVQSLCEMRAPEPATMCVRLRTDFLDVVCAHAVTTRVITAVDVEEWPARS
jgi:hypothetical protein